jgi:transposase-like protein
MEITADMLFETAYPLGCQRFTREEKRTAVRLVMAQDWTYRRAAKEVGASAPAVIRWVEETTMRLEQAGIKFREEEAA